MKNLKALTPQAWVAIALAFVAAATFIAGIIIPPPGEVHPSILDGVGLMIIVVAIFLAWDAVSRVLKTKSEHGKTKITVSLKPNPEAE